MPEFVMLIGLPGCGKSTLAKTLEAKGYHINSSDDIREEFGFSDIECAKTFEILHKRVINDLKEGINSVYDATNLSRKNRINFLTMLKNISCQKIAAFCLVPVEVCKERNSKRTRVVPEYVYDRMLKNFNVPMLEEGFDKINVLDMGSRYANIKSVVDWNYLDSFEQENHHHENTVGKHMRLAELYIKNKSDRVDLIEAARYHDIGKPASKTYEKPNGTRDGEAHYYSHENVGAYLYLIHKMQTNHFISDEDLYVAALINWHMAPYTRWTSDKCFAKDKLHLTDAFIEDINLLHEADVNAH